VQKAEKTYLASSLCSFYCQKGTFVALKITPFIGISPRIIILATLAKFLPQFFRLLLCQYGGFCLFALTFITLKVRLFSQKKVTGDLFG
jgi:hypothetical protein